MSLIPTGRSRSLALTLGAKDRIEFSLALPATSHVGQVGSSGFGCSLAVLVSSVTTINGTEAPSETRNVAGQDQVRYRAALKLTVTTTIPGIETGVARNTFFFSDWTDWYNYSGAVPLGLYGLRDIGDYDRAEAEFNFDVTLAEQINSAYTNNQSDMLVETYAAVVADYSAAAVVSVTITGSAITATENRTASGSDTHSWSQAVATQQLSESAYRLSHTFTGIARGCTNDVSATCSGLDYSRMETGTRGTATLSGGLTATYAKSNNTTIGNGTLTLGPLWSLALGVHNYRYEDGSEFTAETAHYWEDGTLLSTSSTGAHYWPSSGYASYFVINVGDGTLGAIDAYKDLRLLFNTDAAASHTYRHFLKLTDDWADDHGMTASPHNRAGDVVSGTAPGAWYDFQLLPAFDAVEFRVDGVHRYDIFEDVTGIAASGFGASIAMDSGYVHLTSSNSVFDMAVVPAGGTPEVWWPFPYRKFRIAVKTTVAGRKVTVQLTRGIDTTHVAVLEWDLFTTLNNTFEFLEFDILFPTRYSNTLTGSSTPQQEHATDWQQRTAGNAWKVTGQANAEYWFDYLEGFVADFQYLFIGPLCRTEPQQFSFSALEITQELCDASYTYPAAGQFSGGALLAKVVVDGQVGFTISAGSLTLTNEWSTLSSGFGAAAKDTGMTFTDLAHAWQSACNALHGWAITAHGEDAETPPDTDRVLQGAVLRPCCAGYYGMGDVLAQGSYDKQLVLVAKRLYDGELMGQVHNGTASQDGATVNLVDQDGTVVETTETDAFGWYRLFHKYGVVKPFENTGAFDSGFSSNCASRQEYTGTTPSNIVYTTLGKTFAGYWASGDLTVIDGSGYSNKYYTRDTFSILDGAAHWVDLKATAPDLFHYDLVQLPGSPWLFRTYRNSGSAIVERSVDEGHSWPDSLSVLGSFESSAIPTLGALRWDWLLLAAHDSGPASQVWLSKDGGDSFTLLSTISGVRCPRLAVAEIPWVVSHNGTRLEFRYSLDSGVTWTEETGLRITAPAQLCALRVDRRGWLECVYEDGSGDLQHVYSASRVAWSATNNLGTGKYPAYALSTPAAVLLYWDGSTLRAKRLEADYRTVDVTLTAPTGSWKKGTFGVWGTSRDNWDLCGRTSSVQTRYSPDLGEGSWLTP